MPKGRPALPVRRLARVTAAGFVVFVAAACGQAGCAGQLPANRPYESPPAGASRGLLMAFDARTGQTLWESSVPFGAVSAPVAVGGTILVQGGDDCRTPTAVLAAFRASDGIATWQSSTMPGKGGPGATACGIGSAPVAMPGVVAVSANVNGFPAPTVIRGLDPSTGHQLWTASAVDAVTSGGPLLLLVGVPSGGVQLQAVDPTTGAKRWQSGLKSINGPLATTENLVLIANSNGPATTGLTAVELANGDVLWQHDLGAGGQVNSIAASDAAVLTLTPAIVTGPNSSPPPKGPPPQSLIGLDLGTGQELWRRDGVQPANSAGLAAAVAGTVFDEVNTATTSGGCSYSIEALDSHTGTTRWVKNDIPTCSNSGPGFAAGPSVSVIAYTTESGTEVVTLDSRSGATLWARQIQKSVMCDVSPAWCRAGLAMATIAGDTVYVTLSGRFIAPPAPND